MKEILNKIRLGIIELEAMPARYEKLNAEKAALADKIEKLSKSVAGGAGKSVEALGIARERLARLPDDIAELKREHQGTIMDLHNLLAAANPEIRQEYSAARARVTAETLNFLERLGLKGHAAGEITRLVTNEAAAVVGLGNLLNYFSGVNIPGIQINEQVTLARSRFLLEKLAKYLE